MRIITGEYRGRKLETPKGDHIRPTSDKVKEAIFSMLMHDVPGARVIDLFAGTGSLGLEALSRGAEFCQFSDLDRDSIRIININIEKCGAQDKSAVYNGDFRKALKRFKGKADLIFMDPPYGSGFYLKALEEVDSLDLLTEEGIIIAEHEKHVDLPMEVGNLFCYDERRYGKTVVSLYSRRSE